eukprot:gene26574-35242_t
MKFSEDDDGHLYDNNYDTDSLSEVNVDNHSSNLDLRRDIDPNSVYELVSLIGEGSYGAVYKAYLRGGRSDHFSSSASSSYEMQSEILSPHQALRESLRSGLGDESRSGQGVAVKIIPDADNDLTSLSEEIKFLQDLRSPFVVSFIESLLFDNELWLVMELCDGGSLYDLKEAKKDDFNEEDVLGLAHLHSHMSIHRDVKSANILLTRDGRAKLGDFGISARLTDTILKRRTVIGSPYWMAPEVIQETSYDGKADVWSLGITLLELCKPPHFNVHPMRAIFIISSRPAPTLKDSGKWSDGMMDFLSQCLSKNSELRATAEDLLLHPWIRDTVDKIGHNGRGVRVLRDLTDTYSDEVERMRARKFSHSNAVGDLETQLEVAAVSLEELAKQLPTGGGVGQLANLDTVNLVGKSNNEATMMATIRSQGGGSSSFLSSLVSIIHSLPTLWLSACSYSDSDFDNGVPVTRQQLRNASLSRSNTPNGSSTIIRSRSSSGAPAMVYDTGSGHQHILSAAVAKQRKQLLFSQSMNAVSDLNQAANPRFNLTDFSIDYDEIMSDNVERTNSNSKYNDDDGSQPVRYDSKSSSAEEIDEISLTQTTGNTFSSYRTEVDDMGSSLVRVTQPNDTMSSMTALSSTFQRATLIQSQSPKNAREGKSTHQKTRRQQEMQAALKYFKDEPIATTTTTTTTTTTRGTPPSHVVQREVEKPSAEKKNLREKPTKVPSPTRGGAAGNRHILSMTAKSSSPSSFNGSKSATSTTSTTTTVGVGVIGLGDRGGGGGRDRDRDRDGDRDRFEPGDRVFAKAASASFSAYEVLEDNIEEVEAEKLRDTFRKEIKKQLAALKRQYSEDLEELTRSYEARRLQLNDLLAFYASSNTPTTSSSNKLNNATHTNGYHLNEVVLSKPEENKKGEDAELPQSIMNVFSSTVTMRSNNVSQIGSAEVTADQEFSPGVLVVDGKPNSQLYQNLHTQMALNCGVEAVRRLREDGFAHLVVGVTGNVLEDDVIEYLDAGADMVMGKPVKMDMLRMLLRHVKEHGNLSRPDMYLSEAEHDATLLEWNKKERLKNIDK